MKDYLNPKTNMPMFLGLLVVWLTQIIDEIFIWANTYLPDSIEVTTKQVIIALIGIGLGKLVQKYGTIPQETYATDVSEAQTYSTLQRDDPLNAAN